MTERSSNPRNMLSMSGTLAAANMRFLPAEDEESQPIAVPIRQRAYSSTGRSCWQIKRERDKQELMKMENYMEKCEIDRQRATEIRQKKINEIKTKNTNL